MAADYDMAETLARVQQFQGNEVAFVLESNGVVHFPDPHIVGFGWDGSGKDCLMFIMNDVYVIFENFTALARLCSSLFSAWSFLDSEVKCNSLC